MFLVVSPAAATIILDMNGVPWSVSMSFKIPTQLKRTISSWSIFMKVALRGGMASGYLVAKSMITRLYWSCHRRTWGVALPGPYLPT